MTNSSQVYLYGASGHCKVIVEILEANGISIKGIFDDNENIRSLLGYPVLKSDDIKSNDSEEQLIISIGNNGIRKRIAEQLKCSFFTTVHPWTSISKRALLLDGTVVMAGVVVNSEVKVGRHVILNTACSIDHDCVIKDYVHVSPHAALAGNVSVGEGTHIGIGASIIQGVSIGKWAQIGAGAVIIRDVPDRAVVVGNPGRIIKYKNE